MHRHHALILGLTVLSSLPLAASAGPLSRIVPPDSFLNQHVDTVPQLTQQVTMDPVVRRRLARHFHTSGPAVVRYIQDNLILKKITTARRYQVYCIARDGHEYLINSRLAVGTPVFVLRQTNRPILKLACGNPMVASLPIVKTGRRIQENPQLAGLPTKSPGKVVPILARNAPIVVADNFEPGVVVQPGVYKVASSIQLHGGGSSLGYLAALPVVAIASSHSSGNNTGTGSTTGTGGTNNNNSGGTNGNNNGTGTNTGTTNNNNNNGNNNGNNTGVTPVPEPSSTAAFFVGGVGLLFLLAGARRRHLKS